LQSRTYGVALAVAEALEQVLGTEADRLVVDLADYAGELFDPSAAKLIEVTAAVSRSDVIVVASPTFKATYTGLLKAFFDRYGSNGLAGTIAVPVMTGAAAVHALAVETYLRPLLVELGATVPTRGLYVTEAEFADLETPITGWSQAAMPIVKRMLGSQSGD
jgi:FMN reductase